MLISCTLRTSSFTLALITDRCMHGVNLHRFHVSSTVFCCRQQTWGPRGWRRARPMSRGRASGEETRVITAGWNGLRRAGWCRTCEDDCHAVLLSRHLRVRSPPPTRCTVPASSAVNSPTVNHAAYTGLAAAAALLLISSTRQHRQDTDFTVHQQSLQSVQSTYIHT